MRTDRVVSEVLGEEHALTPSDLYNAELKTNLFGGYSKNQVDALLERAADVLETLITRNRELKQQNEQQKEAIETFRDMEDSLRSALVSSQKMSENIIASARFQADAMVEEAKLARAQAVFKMEQLPDALRAEMRRLMEQRDRLREDIANILKTHEMLLGEIPKAEHTDKPQVRHEERSHFVSLHEDEEEKAAEHDADESDDVLAKSEEETADTENTETIPKDSNEYAAEQ